MEVYGTKPERFTKEWWGYFWYYYKWHTAFCAFVAIIVLISCVQCATRTEYDLNITYVSEYGLDTERENRLIELAQKNVQDVTENGKNEVFVLNFYMGENRDFTMLQAYNTKLVLEPSYTESYVFIMTKKYAEEMAKYEFLEKTEVWAGDKANDGYTVSIAECDALSEIGIDAKGEELYVGVVKIREKESKSELERERYKNGVAFAQYLINQG